MGEQSLKYYRDIKNVIDISVEKGFKQGIEKGILKTAKDFKKIGVSVEDIMKATGLSREEIEKM